jgi:chromosome segregation ATPase
VEEEVVLLEEQLMAAQADIEQLQARLSEAEARDEARQAEVAELQRQIAARDESLAAQTVELEDLRAAATEAEAGRREAVQRVRQSVLEREPELPEDLVGGETVADLDAAVDRARQAVAQVRQHLDQRAQTHRVPAGAPARAAPDVGAMSAGEKIREGLRRG